MRHLTYRPSLLLVAAFIFLLLAGQASADSLTVELSRGAIVYNADSSDARFLLLVTLPEALDSAQIQFAELRLPIVSIIPDSTALTIYCRPLLLSRQPENFAWNDLGDNPDTSVVSRKGTHFGTALIGSQTAYFDISRIIKRWQDGALANNGLVLYANPRGLSRFACERSGNDPWATVSIKYERPIN